MKAPGGLTWEQYYRQERADAMHWYYLDLDPDLANALDDLNVRKGHILDLGTGPGTQAIALSIRGFRVTATDISATAVDQARVQAEQQGLEITFREDNILKTRLGNGFDCVFDRGCFHVLPSEKRDVYVSAVHRLLKPGGFFFLKCFSHKEQGESPYRFNPEQIEECFATRFVVLSIVDTVYQGTRNPVPKALFCVMENRSKDAD